MSTDTRIRVSGTALARIQDAQGNLALFTSRKDDRPILRPPGGSFACGAPGRRYLARNCGAAQFEDSRDLRCTVPKVHLDDVVTWFGTRQLRETGVLRVLFEQLIDRTHILKPSDARHLTQQLRWRVQHPGLTARDVPVKNTVYLVEVFDIGLPPNVLAKLKESRTVLFVSPDEILRESKPGGRISSLATCLLPRA